MKTALFALVFALPMAMEAQSTSIPIGKRVRVELPGESATTGTLVSQTPDSVVVMTSHQTRVAYSTRPSLRVHVSDGRSAGLGGLIGMAVGLAAASTVARDLLGTKSGGLGPDGSALPPIFVGGAIGAMIGVEKWRSIQVDAPRVSFRAAPSGAGLGVTLRF
jgi:hypothetical protein